MQETIVKQTPARKELVIGSQYQQQQRGFTVRPAIHGTDGRSVVKTQTGYQLMAREGVRVQLDKSSADAAQ